MMDKVKLTEVDVSLAEDYIDELEKALDRDLTIRELKQQLASKIAWNDNWRTLAKHTAALNKSLVKQLAEKDAEIERLQDLLADQNTDHIPIGPGSGYDDY